MSTDSIDEGEVLWIEPEVCRIPEMPHGFAFRVEYLLGWSDPGHEVWVRGVVLHRGGPPGRSLTLCVPTNQQRAVPASRVPPDAPPAPAPAVGRAPVEDAGPRRRGDRRVVGTPPGYLRRGSPR